MIISLHHGRRYPVSEVWSEVVARLPVDTILFPDTSILLLDVARYAKIGDTFHPCAPGENEKEAHLSWLCDVFENRPVAIAPAVYQEVSEAYKRALDENGSASNPGFWLMTLLDYNVRGLYQWRGMLGGRTARNTPIFIELTDEIICYIDNLKKETETQRGNDDLSDNDRALIRSAAIEALCSGKKTAILSLDEKVRFVANTFKQLGPRYFQRNALAPPPSYELMLQRLDLFAPSPTNRYCKNGERQFPGEHRTF